MYSQKGYFTVINMKNLIYILLIFLFIQCKEEYSESCCYTLDGQREFGLSKRKCDDYNKQKKDGKSWQFSLNGCPVPDPPGGD